jgi:murein DD-endopeptidase MepM/ murein hydrolase activator NlpD
MAFSIIWIICSVICAVLASNKGRGGYGWYVLGAVLALSLPPNTSLSEDIIRRPENDQCEACQQFNRLNTQIRDQEIVKGEARKQISILIPAIKKYALEHGSGQYSRDQWVFPVSGLNVKTAGNSRGADYVSSGYDYFAGNKHGGHPSFDLFIQDKNQDSLDDRTGNPVSVLSMTGGIVVAVENEWNIKSNLKGGKYIWIYDISSDALVYYAHNKEVLVRIGDIVKPGDTIAKVGRTGLNAYKKRSPTHLHLTYLIIKDGYPKPENIYKDLKRAITSNNKKAE